MTPPPALLHVGRVGHARHVAPRRRFTYRIWMLSLDLDRIDEATQASRLFRHNRRGLITLHDADHGPRDGSPLRPWVEAQLRAAGLSDFATRIHFMVIPRVLGYAFNPIAFFFCHDAAGRLGAVLHQVKNTFGHQHAYLVPVASDGRVARHSAGKRLHVSPFFDTDGGYRFTVSAPDFNDPATGFAVRISYGTADEKRMTAAMHLQARPLGDGALLRVLAALPLTPVRIIAAIHWQALRLWLGGARFHRAPPPPPAVSLGVAA
jgi:DUF1365 family protein